MKMAEDARTRDTQEWIECYLREGGDPYLNGGYDKDLQRFLRVRESDRVAARNQRYIDADEEKNNGA